MSSKVTNINNQDSQFELFAISDELNTLLLAYSELLNIKNKHDSSNLLRILNANFKMLLEAIDVEISSSYDVHRAYKIIQNGQ